MCHLVTCAIHYICYTCSLSMRKMQNCPVTVRHFTYWLPSPVYTL